MNGSTVLEFDEDPLQFGIQEAGGTVYLLKAQSRGESSAVHISRRAYVAWEIVAICTSHAAHADRTTR